MSPRYDAVKAGDYAMTVKLLDDGANPNAPVGKKGITAMHRVAAASNRKLELLLESRGGKRVSPAEAKDVGASSLPYSRPTPTLQ